MKFLIRYECQDESIVVVEGHGDDVVNEMQLARKTEDEVDYTDTSYWKKKTNLKDIWMWPAQFNHGDGILKILVQQGLKAVQNIDCEFKEVVRPGQIPKLKGDSQETSFSNFTK